MSHSIAGAIVSGPNWSSCQRCYQRAACPFAYDQMIRQSAWQGHASAQAIKSAASSQKAATASAVDIQTLLEQDHVLFCTLSQIIYQELDSMTSLFTKEVSCS